MNVGELIEKLKTFPPSARVVVDGYEGDCDDIKEVKLQPIDVDGNTKIFPALTRFEVSLAEAGMGKHIKCRENEATEVAVFIMRDGTFK